MVNYRLDFFSLSNLSLSLPPSPPPSPFSLSLSLSLSLLSLSLSLSLSLFFPLPLSTPLSRAVTSPAVGVGGRHARAVGSRHTAGVTWGEEGLAAGRRPVTHRDVLLRGAAARRAAGRADVESAEEEVEGSAGAVGEGCAVR